MQEYRNARGNSGVIGYEISKNAIAVQFSDGGTYLYSYDRPGRDEVEQMKVLAQQGKGLATYINQNVRDKYAFRMR